MGSSASSQPTFTITFNQSRWKAGDTVSGKVTTAHKSSSSAPKIQSLRIQFLAEERVSMETCRVVPIEDSAQRASLSATTVRTSVSTEPTRENSLREPLLEPGYNRITIEADQATSGPPPHRRNISEEGRPREPLERSSGESGESRDRSHDSPRRPLGNNPVTHSHTQSNDNRREVTSRGRSGVSTESSASRARFGGSSSPRQPIGERQTVGRRHDSRIPSHQNRLRAAASSPRRPIGEQPATRSEPGAMSRSSSDSTSSSMTSRREQRAQTMAQRDHLREVRNKERREQRAQRREERSVASQSSRRASPRAAAIHEASRTVAAEHQASNRSSSRPELTNPHPSFREERHTDTATHTIFESDSLLMQVDHTNHNDLSYCPFGWTLPSDAPSSFRWRYGSASAEVVYSVTVYAVSESGDTIGRTTQEFTVDAAPSPQPLLVDPEDLPVVGCCSNKGVLRLGLRGASDTAAIGHRFPIELQVDTGGSRTGVTRSLLRVQETVRLRTPRNDQRHIRHPVTHTAAPTSSTTSLSIPSTAVPSYQGRWVDIQHTLSMTAITSGCCTNDPELTTAINIASQPVATTATSSTTADATMEVPTMATVIPEALVVTVVSDDDEDVVTNDDDDKAFSQPPDTSNQFNPTAPDESLAIV